MNSGLGPGSVQCCVNISTRDAKAAVRREDEVFPMMAVLYRSAEVKERQSPSDSARTQNYPAPSAGRRRRQRTKKLESSNSSSLNSSDEDGGVRGV